MTTRTLLTLIVGVFAGAIADRLVMGTAVHAQEPPATINIGGELCLSECGKTQHLQNLLVSTN